LLAFVQGGTNTLLKVEVYPGHRSAP
jgi:hypothetical protein